MNSEKPTLPRFWHFAWLFFMQPTTLHHHLKDCGIEEPGAPALRLWFAKDDARSIKRQYAQYMLTLLLIAMPIILLAITALFILLGFPINFGKWAFGVAVGVGIGVGIGVAAGVVVGMADGVMVGMADSAAIGMADGVLGGVAYSAAIGVVIGVGIGVLYGVAVGIPDDVTGGVASSGVAIGVVIGVAAGVAAGVEIGVTAGVTAGVAVIIVFLRIFLYPFEIILQFASYFLQTWFNRPTLHWVPVLYHNLSYLPHPLLARHIILAAPTQPQLARQVITACSYSPGQRRAGQFALAHLQAQELERYAQQQQFKQALELQGEWLAGAADAPAALLAIREVARYLHSADTTLIAYHRKEHLQTAEQKLKAVENQLLLDSSALGIALKNTLATWKNQIAVLSSQTQLQTQQLPNPFRAGNPLSPNYGQDVFRGREELVKRIESLLFDVRQNNSIALLGARRTGKTSLLKMLPILLPDAISIFFDLQDNPIDSPDSFFKRLAESAQEQTRQERRIRLPPLPKGTAFEAGSQWLKNLDALAHQQQQRILICIDEFERLENIFPGERRQLLQLMGLFRATIQHRHHVRLLVSGAAPFDELDSLWSDHFINVREVRIGHLDKKTAIELLTSPSKQFPQQAISATIAAAIFARTGGQPFLLQYYGSNLVEHLNQQHRRQAEMADLGIVEEQVLEQATYYFRNTVQNAPESARAVLLALAEQFQPPSLDKQTQRWLRRRCLITEDGQLQIPVLGTWIREYG